MEPISFSEVNPDNLRALAEILNYYIDHTTVSFHTQQVTEADMEQKIFFNNPAFRSFLIKQGDEIIGYCAASPWKKQEAYSQTSEVNIYLAPDYTGKGIGSIAIRHMIDYAAANGIRNLIAGLCSENYPSKRLFEKNGFVQCAHFKGVGRRFGRVLDTIYLQRAIEK